MSETNADSPVPRRRSGCFTFFTLTFLALMIIGGLIVWRALDSGFGLKWLAAQLNKSTVSESFQESVRRIASTNGDVLELSTMDMEESITRFDTKSLFDTFYMGTTESEIKAVVVYRYHLKLSDDWQLKVENGRCVVVAPSIRPSLPPAIRTETMQKKSAAGWMRFNAADNLAQLEKSMTNTLSLRAAAPGKVRHVREASRTSVAQFVRQWVLREKDHQQEPIREIVVIFPDEPAAKDAAQAAKQPPTLLMDVRD